MRGYLKHLWHWRTLTGLALGSAGGVLYSIFIGCKSGCAITSSPILSGLFGALIGASFLMPTRARGEPAGNVPASPPAP